MPHLKQSMINRDCERVGKVVIVYKQYGVCTSCRVFHRDLGSRACSQFPLDFPLMKSLILCKLKTEWGITQIGTVSD